MKDYSILLLVFTFISNVTLAQEDDPRYIDQNTFPFGVVEKIASKELDEERIINIYLPGGYHPDSTETYPTVYVLDGSAHEDFPHIAGLVQFMNMYNLMPKSIVVGIANVNRYRDFTYPSKVKEDIKINPANGGSPKFIRFVKNELQPMIRDKYKTNGHRTIIGQSLGGLLATEILLKEHAMFDDYIIVSPSLWWDNQTMVKGADEFFAQNAQLKKKIFISLGKEHPVMHKVADKLVSAIKESNNENIELYYEPILDEDHATILHIATYRAFKTLNKQP